MEASVDLYLTAEPATVLGAAPAPVAPERPAIERRGQRPAARAADLLPRTGEAICEALIESGSLALAAFEDGAISFASPAFLRLLGLSSAQGETATSWCRRVHTADRERVSGLLADAMAHGHVLGTDCLITEPAGGAIRVHVAGYPGGPAPSSSFTLLLHVDVKSRPAPPAPRLPAPVRRAFARTKSDVLDRAGELLVDAWLKAETLAVMAVGLTPPVDGWTAEERYHAEEALLARLRPCLRDGDAIGRSGDGGLLVAIPNLSGPCSAGIVAGRLIDAARRGGGTDAPHPCVNIGIALFPGDDQELSGLLAHAGAALDLARQGGACRYSLAETSLNRTLEPRPVDGDPAADTGLAEVDAPHHRLGEALRTLAHDVGASSDAGTLQAGLQVVRDALAEDFRVEEALMSAHPGAANAAHAREHLRALRNLGFLAHADVRLGTALSIGFLEEWLAGHVRDYDAPLVVSTFRPLW